MDTSKLVPRPTPEAWRREFKQSEVSVLSLVKDPAKEHQNGWVSYRSYLLDSPEVEIISGGLSERSSDSAALWRQGHLLHFAFDLAPAEMNATGQALLLNSIAYIARFTEDRPIARTPAAFHEPDISIKSKRWIQFLFASQKPADKDLDFYLAPATKTVVKEMERPAFEQWYSDNSPFLTCDPVGKLVVDAAAKELGMVFEKPEFFTNAIAKLRDSARAGRARELLKRHAPEGPADGSAEEWTKWWETNRPYLFYSEGGGYRWYLDPLAKRRGIPSEKLRGPARATAN